MKKALKIAYGIISDTAILFTVTIMLMALFLLSTTTARLEREVILSIFGFAATFGLSAVFGYIEPLPRALVSILRFILTAVGFVIFILIPFNRAPVQMFVATVFFTVAYWVIFTAVKLIALPFRKKEDEAEE